MHTVVMAKRCHHLFQLCGDSEEGKKKPRIVASVLCDELVGLEPHGVQFGKFSINSIFLKHEAPKPERSLWSFSLRYVVVILGLYHPSPGVCVTR